MKCPFCQKNEEEYQVFPKYDWYWEYWCCKDCLKSHATDADQITLQIQTEKGPSFKICDTNGDPKL
jgi:hypothetical protein